MDNPANGCVKPIKINTHQIYKMLNIEPSSLRTYELEGLISPFYFAGERFFSQDQVVWISCIEHMINEKGISIPGLTRLLRLCPCWDIAECPAETQKKCKAKSISLSLLENNRLFFKTKEKYANENYWQVSPTLN